MFALNENEEQFYITEYLKALWKKKHFKQVTVYKRVLVVVKRLRHIFNTSCHDLWMEFIMKHTLYLSDNITVKSVSMKTQSCK